MKDFLKEEEKKILREKHYGVREKRLADRIKSILLLDKGHTFLEIEEILMLDDATLRRYEKIYQESGLDGLISEKYGGYEGKLNCQQIEKLKQHMREYLMRSAKEVASWIKQTYDINYTPEGLVHFLHRIGFSYKKTRQVPSKGDIKKQEAFVQEYKELKKTLKEKDKIYFLDGVHPQHNSMPAYGWIETGKEKKVLSNTGRQRLNINGALDAQSHEVIIRDDERIDAYSTINLLKQIEEKNPEANQIFAIADNAKYYKSRLVNEFLETSKVKMVFLPPYSPNLNIIERLWKFFKQKVLRGYYYENFEEFREKTIDFFRNVAIIYKEELNTLLTENFSFEYG